MGLQLRQFKRDERGLSGVEFALISPILITLLLGSHEIGRYVRIDRQLTTTADTVAELMAQEEGPLE